MKSTPLPLPKTSIDHHSLGFHEPFSDDRINNSRSLIHDLHFPERNCRILNEDDIRQRIDDQISEISSLLCLPKPQARLLLCFFNFSVAKIHDSWFSDEPDLRRKLGLLQNPVKISSTDFTCGICFEQFPTNMISFAACAHPFCNDCWSKYISTSVNNDGIHCLILRCPEPSCNIPVGPDLIDKLLYRNDRFKYSKCLVRSYVEGHRNIKWCPGPGCNYAIDLEGSEKSDITCRCFTSICRSCDEESHRPVDCQTVKRWLEKNESESQNLNYILKYCKPCPNCRRPIEKNEGCMHMTCKICRHSFCWLCLSPYSNHPQCNGFSNHEVRKKEMAKQSLEKYTHYFERWDANRKSRLKALQDFRQVKNVTFKQLSQDLGVTEGDLDFVSKAWLQVAECRRVLEWSYVYGYYMPEKEHTKRVFFEYLQGEAEDGLERLHKCLDPNDFVLRDFVEFRTMLVGLTAVTGNYFEKLVTALENGLSDVVSCGDRASSSRDEESEDYWFCDRCSFANPGYLLECMVCVLENED